MALLSTTQAQGVFLVVARSYRKLIQLRFTLTETEELQGKILKMSQRIRQLEEALSLLQSNISSEKHPLLREQVASAECKPEQMPSDMLAIPGDTYAESLEAFGTLTIGDGGELRYFGASAGSEVRFSVIVGIDTNI